MKKAFTAPKLVEEQTLATMTLGESVVSTGNTGNRV